MRSTKIIKICSSSLCTCLHHMVILRTRNKITDFWMILAWASPFKAFKQSVKLRLKEQFIQTWHKSISQVTCTKYRIIKITFGFENYLNDLPDLLRKYFTKFRCRNHRLPIEAGVRSQVLRDMRVCQFCKTDIGDEFHYLLCCFNFKEERKKIYRG